MDQIILDAGSNAYLFDGTHVKDMGKVLAFKELWEKRIFSIAQDIYWKKGDTYRLLAKDAKFLTFGKSDLWAKRQFEIIGRTYVYVEPNKPGIFRFPENPAYKVLYTPEIPNLADKGFVLYHGKKCEVYLFNERKEPILSQEEALLCQNALFWNGHGYVFDGNCFHRKPWQILAQKASYLVLNLDGILFALHADGQKQILGRLKEKVPTRNGNIFVLENDGIVSCWFFLQTEPQEIISVYDPETQFFRIGSDDTILFHERREMDSVPYVVDSYYQLQDSGYRCIRTEEY